MQLHYLEQKPRHPTARPWLLVLMHGVGSHERDLFALAPHVPPAFHVLSLRAPFQVAPDGYAWFVFDVLPDGGRRIDVAQEAAARAAIAADVRAHAERLGIAPQRIVLGGFSQGGVMALSLLLTAPADLRAALVLHGRLLPEALPQQAPAEALAGRALWVSHGVDDAVLRLAEAQRIRAHVQPLPLTLSYHEYPGGHEIRAAEWQGAAHWLQALTQPAPV